MLEQKVDLFLKKKKEDLTGKKLLVGVSGGPDSLALLYYLWKRQERYGMEVAVAHLDHMFRGSESADEAIFVKHFCEQRNIPVFAKQVNVTSYMQQTGYSPQVAARKCRYDFFAEIMQKEESDLLVLGHHGDDQIETILMRLTRGSTGKARIGIPFTRPFGEKRIIRPFLTLTKSEIEHYCQEEQLSPRLDPSNNSDKYGRNRFRTRVLPFLKEENPKAHDHFQRFSEEMEESETFLEEMAEERLKEAIIVKDKEVITIDIGVLGLMPMPLQRRSIKLILNYLYQQQPSSLSAVHIDQIFSVMASNVPSGKLYLPEGLRVSRSYKELTLSFKAGLQCHHLEDIEGMELKPGVNVLANGDLLTWEYVSGELEYTNNNQLLIPLHILNFPIKVRTRRAGDRMSLKGLKGTKKVKDIFIDKKVPQQERAYWPVVTDCHDVILWLPGLKKSNDSAWREMNEKQYILLQYTKQRTSRGQTNHDEK